MLCLMDYTMLGFLPVVAMLSRVHRVYVRMVCISDGCGSIFGGVAMAFKSGPVFGPVFWAQKCGSKKVKPDCRASRFWGHICGRIPGPKMSPRL